jgi:hypothetical protein
MSDFSFLNLQDIYRNNEHFSAISSGNLRTEFKTMLTSALLIGGWIGSEDETATQHRMAVQVNKSEYLSAVLLQLFD